MTGHSARAPLAFLVASLAALTGCVLGPIDGDRLNSTQRADFYGYATSPSAHVRVQAFRWSDSTWVTLEGETTASATPSMGVIPYKSPLYAWSLSVTVPNWGFSLKRARLRSQQLVDPEWQNMYMYDQAGKDCIVARHQEAIDRGDPVFDATNAGIECSDDGAGNHRYEVRVTRP